VIQTDPYATAPVDTDKFGANWTGLEAFARQLRGESSTRGTTVVVQFKKTLKSQFHLKAELRSS
jgi:hypothetical protein